MKPVQGIWGARGPALKRMALCNAVALMLPLLWEGALRGPRIDLFYTIMITLLYLLVADLAVGTALVLLSFMFRRLFDYGLSLLLLFLVILLICGGAWLLLFWRMTDSLAVPGF